MPSLNEHMLRSEHNGVVRLTFNRPEKFNALDASMYASLIDNLNEIASNPNLHIVVITGNGKYYSSGNDMLAVAEACNQADSNVEQVVNDSFDLVKRYVDVLIDFPKILVAIVNGPAIGITVTTLALFDLVYATENATFQTPFTKIGLCAEGCSSVTFPEIFGRSKCTELLSFNYKMTAREALALNFIGRVIRPEQIDAIQTELEHACAHNSNKSLLTNKQLLRDTYSRTRLHDANARETLALKQCYRNGDFIAIIMRMFAHKI